MKQIRTKVAGNDGDKNQTRYVSYVGKDRDNKPLGVRTSINVGTGKIGSVADMTEIWTKFDMMK